MVLGLAPLAAAQPVAAPTIHRVTVHPDTGVLTVTGTGLGPDLQVTVDGLPVPQLPGASDTQMEVLAPITVVTQPGTYRLTVVDPMRRVGDGFVVVSPMGSVVTASDAEPGRLPDDPATTATPGAEVRGGTPAERPAPRPTPAGPSPNLIEGPTNTAIDVNALVSITTGFFNTASGVEALFANTTGSSNTASGATALSANTTGQSNTASGYRAGLFATTGSYNIFLGADVYGTAADTNTIRIGLPYNAGVGQNRTFIAGIQGTQLTGPAVPVYIDANGQLGTLTPPIVSGTISAPVSFAVPQQLQAQQAAVAELRAENAAQRANNAAQQVTLAELNQRSQAQQATMAEMQTIIADLRARLAQLEASGTRRR